jgi:hypothetical protein
MSVLWVVAIIILALWLLGFVGSIGGELVHLLLVVFVIIVLYNLLAGRRSG